MSLQTRDFDVRHAMASAVQLRPLNVRAGSGMLRQTPLLPPVPHVPVREDAQGDWTCSDHVLREHRWVASPLGNERKISGLLVLHNAAVVSLGDRRD